MQVAIGLNWADIRKVIWTFAEAAFATFLVLDNGIGQAPNLNAAKSVAVGALIGAVAAGWSAVKNFVLADSSTIK